MPKGGLERARAVGREHKKKADKKGHLVVSTPAGDVVIEALTVVEDGDASYVDVRVNGAIDPNFRIVNPPTLVPDATGDVEINGIRFREDPIAAIAYVLASNGGLQKKQKDARRGGRR